VGGADLEDAFLALTGGGSGAAGATPVRPVSAESDGRAAA
jgi:hypothetical protein